MSNVIASTPGVDCVYIGPSDLAYALGLTPTGDNRDPKHEQACMDIMAACRRAGVAPGMHTGSQEFTEKWLQAGFQMVNLGSDLGSMRRTIQAELNGARANTGTPYWRNSPMSETTPSSTMPATPALRAA